MTSDATPYRRFAWDGLMFDVPADWNLSRHETRGAASSLAMEDDLALRFEMEWTRSSRPLAFDKIRRRYDESAAEMRQAGAEVAVVTDLPPGWSAGLYTMSDGRRLVNALFLGANGLVCVFSLHFDRSSFREPLRVMRRLADGFTINREPAMTWDLLDMAFRLNREFRLAATAFEAGSKLMEFEWRWRRLFIWGFSPADVIVARQPVEQWCARVLNRFKTIRGPVFRPGATPGELVWRRDWRYPFGRFEDLYRRCHRYQARCEILPAKNLLMLTVFQYRTASDLRATMLEWLEK